MQSDWIVPDWPAARSIGALVTTRNGGASRGVYGGAGGGMNLSLHCGDEESAVLANRAHLGAVIAARPRWLHQVHGTRVIDADTSDASPEADAAYTRTAGVACAVLVADCMPVLFCDEAGEVVAAAHAGWRGLAGGVLERTIASMDVAPERIMAYLGPAIGPRAFEVGGDVLRAFCADDAGARAAFSELPGGKYLADLFALTRRRLERAGVLRIYGGDRCTLSTPEQFYSYRRDRVTGRMAGLIWIVADGGQARADRALR